MCLPSVNWSSVVLATPNANSKKVQAAVLMISRRFHFSADTNNPNEIRLNQRDPTEYVKAEIKKNETWNANKTAQAELTDCCFPQPFL